MTSKQPAAVNWFNYPVSFYFDLIERPWAGFSLLLLALYLLSFWLELNYLEVIIPLTLAGQILTVGVATYWYGIRRPLPLKSLLALGGLLGGWLGLTSALLALLRWWHLWLFFNLITESMLTAALGVMVALGTIWLFKLPWFNKFSGTPSQFTIN